MGESRDALPFTSETPLLSRGLWQACSLIEDSIAQGTKTARPGPHQHAQVSHLPSVVGSWKTDSPGVPIPDRSPGD